jgi:WXG100 family type VII secretion target
MAATGPTTTVGGVTYRVTPEYLTGAAASCDSTAQQIDAILTQIRSYVVTLEGEWHGVAQQQFQLLMTDYDLYSRMLHDALTDIGSGLRGTYVNYTDSENTNISNLVGVHGSIPGTGKIANLT